MQCTIYTMHGGAPPPRLCKMHRKRGGRERGDAPFSPPLNAPQGCSGRSQPYFSTASRSVMTAMVCALDTGISLPSQAKNFTISPISTLKKEEVTAL